MNRRNGQQETGLNSRRLLLCGLTGIALWLILMFAGAALISFGIIGEGSERAVAVCSVAASSLIAGTAAAKTQKVLRLPAAMLCAAELIIALLFTSMAVNKVVFTRELFVDIAVILLCGALGGLLGSLGIRQRHRRRR